MSFLGLGKAKQDNTTASSLGTRTTLTDAPSDMASIWLHKGMVPKPLDPFADPFAGMQKNAPLKGEELIPATIITIFHKPDATLESRQETNTKILATINMVHGVSPDTTRYHDHHLGIDIGIADDADPKAVAKDVVAALTTAGLLSTSNSQEAYRGMALDPNALPAAAPKKAALDTGVKSMRINVGDGSLQITLKDALPDAKREEVLDAISGTVKALQGMEKVFFQRTTAGVDILPASKANDIVKALKDAELVDPALQTDGKELKKGGLHMPWHRG